MIQTTVGEKKLYMMHEYKKITNVVFVFTPYQHTNELCNTKSLKYALKLFSRIVRFRLQLASTLRCRRCDFVWKWTHTVLKLIYRIHQLCAWLGSQRPLCRHPYYSPQLAFSKNCYFLYNSLVVNDADVMKCNTT